MNETGVDDYMDAQDKRIAELQAECKENGTALNRTLLVLKEAQTENERLDDHAKKWGIKAQELEAENERLRVVIDRLEQDYKPAFVDAERYRWLRDEATPDELSIVESFLWEQAEELDATIDAAMEKN